MKVCMLIYSYWPEKAGGAESQCRKLVGKFILMGIDCTVVTGRHHLSVPSRQEVDGCTIIRLATFETLLQKLGLQKTDFPTESGAAVIESGQTEYKKLSPKIKIKHLIAAPVATGIRCFNSLIFGLNVIFFFLKREKDISLIHVHIADWLAGVAALSGRFSRIPVVCKGANQPVLPELKGIPFASLLNHWRKRLAFIALTDSMKQELLLHDILSERIRVIPNGVIIPEKIAAVEQNPSFLFVGNFSQTAAHKGFDILLHAWQGVVMKEPAARMVFAGGGDSSPWRSLAHQLGIEGTITFAGYQTNLEEYYLDAACLVLPSRKEGISNALLEAQSYGLPAIVSDIPGNREVVVDGVTGCIVPVGNSEFLTAAILKIYRSPLLRKQYGKAARDRIVENFSMDSVALKVRRLYEDLLQ